LQIPEFCICHGHGGMPQSSLWVLTSQWLWTSQISPQFLVWTRFLSGLIHENFLHCLSISGFFSIASALGWSS
jgi:hypothetical protein